MVATTRRAAVYARVSTDDQAENGYSLHDQGRKGQAQADAKGWTVVDTPYVDDGVSGTLRHRPALDRLLRDVDAGKVDVVICTKMDRLARNLKLLLEIFDSIEAAGATVVVIEESIDTSTSVGRLIRNVLGSIAEFERDTIVARTGAGQVNKIKAGHAWRARDAYGYRYVAGKGRGEPGHFEVVPDLAPIVRRIFEGLAGGMSATAVSMALTADGIPTQRGARNWSGSTIQRIVHNPIYRGEPAWGRQATVKTLDGTRKQRKQTAPDAILYGACPAIVSAHLQEQAEAQLESNRVYATRNSKADYLLRGLLRCGAVGEDGATCGYAMIGHEGRRYQCNYHASTGQRKRHGVALQPVEDAVWTALRGILLDPARVLDQARALADSGTTEARDLDAQLAQLQKDAARHGTRQDALLDLYLDGGLSKEHYATKCAALDAQRQECERLIVERQARRAAALDKMLPVAEVEAACAWVGRGIDSLTFQERQHVVRALCTRVTTNRESVTIDGYLPILTTTVRLGAPVESTFADTLSP